MSGGNSSGTIAAGDRAEAALGSIRLPGLLARVGLPHLLLLAVALRLAVLAIATPAHPDEVFQYLETAHRIVFGQGVVTWEWRAGMRGWLLPVLVSGPMWLGAALDPHGGLYLLLPKLVATVASLVVVAVPSQPGEPLSQLPAPGTRVVAPIWYDFIYLPPHMGNQTARDLLILPPPCPARHTAP